MENNNANTVMVVVVVVVITFLDRMVIIKNLEYEMPG